MYEFTPVGWLKHCVFHPVEGFEDLRWKKQGSMKISMLIVLFLFIAMVVDRQLTGFQFNDSYVKVFNVVPLIVQSVVYFFTWVLGNWAICTLLDGEGTLKKICIYSAYSLVPYIVCTFIAVIFSNVLAMRAVHQYSFGKTLASIIGTIIAMLLILFLAILLLSLFQQVYVFGYSVYTEIMYRIRG